MDLDIRFKKLRIDAVVPAYAHGSAEDAGLDLTYCADHPAAIAPGGRSLLSTGIAIELPSGFEGQIRPRSGLALSRGLTILNAPGTIDPGYRGEVRVLLINLGDTTQTVNPGERIAQLVISQYTTVRLREVSELETSDRGDSGFGGSGA
jgi:dUTP pyrophosphatase